MKNEPDFVELGKFFEVNPSRVISRGDVTPFIPMDALIENSRQVSQISYREYTGSGVRFKNGDTLIARITPCLENGKTVFISNLDDNVIGHGSTEFIVLSGKAGISDNLYAYYLARSPDFRSFAISHMEGTSGRQRVPTSVIKKYRTKLPPLPEQRAIAAILGALDDKIELNCRMNRTLEEMAWVVYKDFVKDEKGIETKIGDVLSIVGGSTPSTANPEFWEDGDICWATPKDLALLKSPILLDTKSKITKLGLQQISSGLLPVGTVLLSSRAPIGYLAIAHVPVAINQGFIAIKCTDEIPNYFILNWLKDNMDEIIGRANGTTFMEISKSNFRPIQIAIPPFEKMSEFVKIVEPIYQRIVASLEEINTITEIRDTLLPKLMTGQMQASLIFESDDKHGSNFQLNIGHERET
jgi:type I restriction enzyme S subunit